jgi:hypothetical protein
VKRKQAPFEQIGNYETPFGYTVKPLSTSSSIHERWCKKLFETWPLEVPAESLTPDEKKSKIGQRPWPVTFGIIKNGKVQHRVDEGNGTCLQCGACKHCLAIENNDDWGVCSNPKSQYDRTAVFEHWTCKFFERAE